MQYYRVCPAHNTLPDDEMRCLEYGHVCERWLIVDENGVQVGVADEENGGILLLGYFEQQSGQRSLGVTSPPKAGMPTLRCRRGHYNWFYKTLDNRWRCRDCDNHKRTERKEAKDKIMAKIKQLSLQLEQFYAAAR